MAKRTARASNSALRDTQSANTDLGGLDSPALSRDDDGTPELETGTPQRAGTDSKSQVGDFGPIPGIDTVSPFDIDGGSGSGDGFGRRRGRPKGSRNTPKTQAPQDLTANLESLLLSVHLMGAAILHVDELALDAEEAKKLADAIREVAKHYPMGIDPKKIAVANLAIVATGIYGTRAVAIYKRAGKARQPRPMAVPQPIRQPERVETELKPQPNTAPLPNVRTPQDMDPSGVDDLSQL